MVPNGGCAAWSASSSSLVVSGRRSKSSQPCTSVRRERQKALERSTSPRPPRSFRSCRSFSSSALLTGDCPVADLERGIEDLEALVELGFGDAERGDGHDHIPARERVHASFEQGLGDRLHLG